MKHGQKQKKLSKINLPEDTTTRIKIRNHLENDNKMIFLKIINSLLSLNFFKFSHKNLNII